MAFTTPKSWSVGELVTASSLNTHLRDNLSYLKGQAGGTVVIETNVSIGPTSAAANASLEIGGNGSGDFSSFIDFHAAESTYSDFALRIIRNASANGTSVIAHRGTGAISITRSDGAALITTGAAGAGGWCHFHRAGVAGTAITILPAGSVQYAWHWRHICKPSTGTEAHNSGSSGAVPGNATLYSVGADICLMHVNADGSVDVQRTGGSLTYTVSIDFMWL